MSPVSYFDNACFVRNPVNTIARINRELKKCPCTPESLKKLFLELEEGPRIRIATRFTYHAAPDAFWSRYVWTLLISPFSNRPEVDVWYLLLYTHLLLTCDYRVNDNVLAVKEELFRLADMHNSMYGTAQLSDILANCRDARPHFPGQIGKLLCSPQSQSIYHLASYMYGTTYMCSLNEETWSPLHWEGMEEPYNGQLKILNVEQRRVRVRATPLAAKDFQKVHRLAPWRPQQYRLFFEEF